eukprot:TRINITY_DN8457_c0_g1_i1.p1 TRINITY_DN8457_c0_g1~~TRINITY_DN8457_c0_g1_i1.p1  ORF type:complete len:1686 (+),score=195.49 TRINITY_DN8457_c0_g1_i1:67-5124(+)
MFARLRRNKKAEGHENEEPLPNAPPAPEPTALPPLPSRPSQPNQPEAVPEVANEEEDQHGQQKTLASSEKQLALEKEREAEQLRDIAELQRKELEELRQRMQEEQAQLQQRAIEAEERAIVAAREAEDLRVVVALTEQKLQEAERRADNLAKDLEIHILEAIHVPPKPDGRPSDPLVRVGLGDLRGIQAELPSVHTAVMPLAAHPVWKAGGTIAVPISLLNTAVLHVELWHRSIGGSLIGRHAIPLDNLYAETNEMSVGLVDTEGHAIPDTEVRLVLIPHSFGIKPKLLTVEVVGTTGVPAPSEVRCAVGNQSFETSEHMKETLTFKVYDLLGPVNVTLEVVDHAHTVIGHAVLSADKLPRGEQIQLHIPLRGRYPDAAIEVIAHAQGFGVLPMALVVDVTRARHLESLLSYRPLDRLFVCLSLDGSERLTPPASVTRVPPAESSQASAAEHASVTWNERVMLDVCEAVGNWSTKALQVELCKQVRSPAMREASRVVLARAEIRLAEIIKEGFRGWVPLQTKEEISEGLLPSENGAELLLGFSPQGFGINILDGAYAEVTVLEATGQWLEAPEGELLSVVSIGEDVHTTHKVLRTAHPAWHETYLLPLPSFFHPRWLVTEVHALHEARSVAVGRAVAALDQLNRVGEKNNLWLPLREFNPQTNQWTTPLGSLMHVEVSIRLLSPPPPLTLKWLDITATTARLPHPIGIARRRLGDIPPLVLQLSIGGHIHHTAPCTVERQLADAVELGWHTHVRLPVHEVEGGLSNPLAVYLLDSARQFQPCGHVTLPLTEIARGECSAWVPLVVKFGDGSQNSPIYVHLRLLPTGFGCDPISMSVAGSGAVGLPLSNTFGRKLRTFLRFGLQAGDGHPVEWFTNCQWGEPINCALASFVNPPEKQLLHVVVCDADEVLQDGVIAKGTSKLDKLFNICHAIHLPLEIVTTSGFPSADPAQIKVVITPVGFGSEPSILNVTIVSADLGFHTKRSTQDPESEGEEIRVHVAVGEMQKSSATYRPASKVLVNERLEFAMAQPENTTMRLAVAAHRPAKPGIATTATVLTLGEALVQIDHLFCRSSELFVPLMQSDAKGQLLPVDGHVHVLLKPGAPFDRGQRFELQVIEARDWLLSQFDKTGRFSVRAILETMERDPQETVAIEWLRGTTDSIHWPTGSLGSELVFEPKVDPNTLEVQLELLHRSSAEVIVIGTARLSLGDLLAGRASNNHWLRLYRPGVVPSPTAVPVASIHVAFTAIGFGDEQGRLDSLTKLAAVQVNPRFLRVEVISSSISSAPFATHVFAQFTLPKGHQRARVPLPAPGRHAAPIELGPLLPDEERGSLEVTLFATDSLAQRKDKADKRPPVPHPVAYGTLVLNALAATTQEVNVQLVYIGNGIELGQDILVPWLALRLTPLGFGSELIARHLHAEAVHQINEDERLARDKYEHMQGIAWSRVVTQYVEVRLHHLRAEESAGRRALTETAQQRLRELVVPQTAAVQAAVAAAHFQQSWRSWRTPTPRSESSTVVATPQAPRSPQLDTDANRYYAFTPSVTPPLPKLPSAPSRQASLESAAATRPSFENSIQVMWNARAAAGDSPGPLSRATGPGNPTRPPNTPQKHAEHTAAKSDRFTLPPSAAPVPPFAHAAHPPILPRSPGPKAASPPVRRQPAAPRNQSLFTALPTLASPSPLYAAMFGNS